MPMTGKSLHGEGWRQGSVFHAELPTLGIAFDTEKKKPISRHDVHGLWLVTSQDCTLDRTKPASNTPSVELRQVLHDQPPAHWGIHARKFLLDRELGHYLVDDKPINFVSPRMLSNIEEDGRLYTLHDDRVLALKTWLGNRYDRPAVPPKLVPIARSIAESIAGISDRTAAKGVRDVYMTFEPVGESINFSLYAITENGANQRDVREWLADAALEIPVELGVASGLEVGTASEVTLNVVESWYCADLSQLTWADQPGPHGVI